MPKKHFEKIHKSYKEFEKHLLSKGQLPAMDTGIGYWGVTNCQDLFEFFQKIKLEKYKNFIDLGSGDGRVVLIASLFGLKATGIEHHPWLTDCALHLKRKIGLPHFKNVKILKDDFMKYHIGEHDLVYISPDRPFHRDGLGTKFSRELNGKLVVHSYEFLPKSLKQEATHIVNGEKFSVFSRHKE